MITAFIPNVFAATYGAVTVLTNPDDVEIVTNRGKTTITYKNPIDIQIAEEDETLGRPGGSGWLGMRINAPSDSNENSLKDATYYSIVEGVGESKATAEVKKFLDKRDGSWYIDIWSGISLDRIREAEQNNLNSITRDWYFDWDGNGVYEQEVTVVMPLININLTDENGNVLYTPESMSEKVKTEKLDNIPKTGFIYAIVNYLSYLF